MWRRYEDGWGFTGVGFEDCGEVGKGMGMGGNGWECGGVSIKWIGIYENGWSELEWV